MTFRALVSTLRIELGPLADYDIQSIHSDTTVTATTTTLSLTQSFLGHAAGMEAGEARSAPATVLAAWKVGRARSAPACGSDGR